MSASTLRIFIAIFLVAHGLIYYSLTTATLPQAGGLHTPYWPSWWREAVDNQWLATHLGFSSGMVRAIGSLLWLVAAIGFVLVGLGVLGIPGLKAIWQPVALVAAVDSLLLFVLYWHPWFVVGAGINVAVLASLWQSWPAALFSAR